MRDSDVIMRDLFIACFHPEYRDQPPIETLRELRAARESRGG